MLSLNSWSIVACFSLAIAGCGGDFSVDSPEVSAESHLRLASEGATVKPWDPTADTVVVAERAELAPVKVVASTAALASGTIDAGIVSGAGSPSNAGTASPAVSGTAAAPSATSATTARPSTRTEPVTSTVPAASIAPEPAVGRVPSGTVSAYDPNSLPIIGGEPSASTLWPKWRQSLGRWQWIQIPGTDLSTITPNPAVPGALSARIDAWNGLAADPRTNRLFSAANGGHADYAGNEVYSINLSDDAPRWKMLRGPTPASEIVASDYSKNLFHDYYLDGRPASTHTYYALNFLASRNAIFKFGAGSLWGSGNESNWKIDAFSLAANDWQPAGTWPDANPYGRGGTIAASICKDPRTETVYLSTPRYLRRFNPTTGAVEQLAAWPDNETAVYARACAVDPERNRVVFFGDGYRAPTGGLVYDISRNAFVRIDFTGEPASYAVKGDYHFAWYEPKLGYFLLKTNRGSEVLAVDPQTFLMQQVGTAGAERMPNVANGVHTRWQRLPDLGGYAFYPAYGSGIWFLAIE